MARRGRPPSPRAAAARVVHIKLRLYPGEDDDLSDFFSAIAPRLRATLVKQALRHGAQAVSPGDGQAEDGRLLQALDAFVL